MDSARLEANKSYSTVSPPWWDEVWIVAGGPSARQFDFSRLAGKQVLGVNDAIDLPLYRSGACACLFSADPDWVRRELEYLHLYEGPKYAAIALDTHPDLADLPGVTYLQRCHEDGLSFDPGFVCTGGNSGYAAINLAVLKGAKLIHLVGYDMDPSTRGQGDKFEQWIPRFRTMLPQLEEHGIRVINHNLHSHIDAFPKEA